MYLLMTTSSQGHLVEEVLTRGGHIGFEGYSAGFNGPSIPPMTGDITWDMQHTLQQHV